MLLGATLGAVALPAAAFQETTVGGAQKPAVAAVPSVEAPKQPVDMGKGVTLTVPEVGVGKSSGTEVRIPGIGTVGVLPKLDFGLEILYGANDGRGVPVERSDPGDVQIRGTIRHRF